MGSLSSRERVGQYRQRLRARGLRPVQLWVPDVSSPEFLAEARRQSLGIAQSPGEVEDMAFIASLGGWEDD